jgi:hypothetical protein
MKGTTEIPKRNKYKTMGYFGRKGSDIPSIYILSCEMMG